MLKLRVLYIGLILITIVVGLLSRQYSEIPMFIGDVLWGLMVFLIVRLLFVYKPIRFTVIVSLIYSYLTEFSQLYQAPWIHNLRQYPLIKLVIGEHFLFTDMLCYTIGIGLGVLTELSLRKLSTRLYAVDEELV
jgi:hypothetical protein